MQINYKSVGLLRAFEDNGRPDGVYWIMGDESTALAIAKDIYLEQTLEFPEECIPEGEMRDSFFGRIEKIEITEQRVKSEHVEEIGNE